MAPFNHQAAPSSGRYRRRIVAPPSPERCDSSNISSAVAAAELAVSSIILSSDNKQLLTTNGNIWTNANNLNNNNNMMTNNKPPPSRRISNVIQNLRASRSRRLILQQRTNDKKWWFQLKIVLLVIGFIFIVMRLSFTGTSDDGSNSGDNHDRKGTISNNVEKKLSVPLPPSSNFRHHNHHKTHSDKNSNGHPAAPPKKINPAIHNTANNKNDNIINNNNNNNHHHVIPPVLTFTYHTNLLTTPITQLTDEEDIALSQNIHQIINLHSESTVHFLTDTECISSIQNTLGYNTNLTTYFRNEKHGMYKADICRGAALYETGGLYFDIDVETRNIPLWDVILPNTEFVTTLVHKDSNHLGNFFQAFIGVTKHHPIMKRYLELFVEYYEGRVKVDGPLGVYFLRMAYDEIIMKGKKKHHGSSDNEEDDDHDNNSELWQEVRYSPNEFPEVYRSRWGKRRACQMMVVAPPIKKKNKNGRMSMRGGGGREGDLQREKRMVPLFSHANGSRMCGGKDTHLKGNSETA